jgi:hypothetical protein
MRLVVDNKERLFDRGMSIKALETEGGKQFKDWAPPVPTEQLKSLGFDCWLKDLITGPEEVINTLCHQNQVHATVHSRLCRYLTLGCLTSQLHTCAKRRHCKTDY